MGRRFAIGDVHGCARTLKKLVNQLELTTEDKLYFVGDLVDRGPDSKGVVDIIFDLHEKGITAECVMGNHEELMIDSIHSEESAGIWSRNGGMDTLRSFGAVTYDKLEDRYKQYFESLPNCIELDGWYIVHAGFDFRRENFLEDEKAMRWIRFFEPDETRLGGKRIVHGHTPMYLPEVKLLVNNKDLAIDLDSGCCYTENQGMAHLCCLDLDTEELITVPNAER